MQTVNIMPTHTTHSHHLSLNVIKTPHPVSPTTHTSTLVHLCAGDDLQRQLGSLTVLRPSKVFRIFITRLTPDCLLGLPGLMCTIGAARVRGHASADIPVHIYGPQGIAEFLCIVFKVGKYKFLAFEAWHV